MSLFYVGCILGTDNGRVVLGNLHKGEFQVTEVHRFALEHITHKGTVQWNIPHIYQQILDSLRTIAGYEEPVQSVSCSSEAGDYLIFNQDRALVTPAIHHEDGAAQALRKKVQARMPWELMYEETGVSDTGANMFLQLGFEPAKRLKHAHSIVPLADGLNILLGAEATMELSMASATGLYNPVFRRWSSSTLEALKFHSDFFPPIVMPGTIVGRLKDEIAKATGLDDARVIASCSNEMAAKFAGIPANQNETWGFLHAGSSTMLGTPVAQPLINEITRELRFTNQLGYDGSVCFYKRSTGLSILEECQRYWEERDRSLDYDLLSHLAGSSTPFDCLVDPSDPRFATPGDSRAWRCIIENWFTNSSTSSGPK
jgi:rhamnulokinase